MPVDRHLLRPACLLLSGLTTRQPPCPEIRVLALKELAQRNTERGRRTLLLLTFDLRISGGARNQPRRATSQRAHTATNDCANNGQGNGTDERATRRPGGHAAQRTMQPRQPAELADLLLIRCRRSRQAESNRTLHIRERSIVRLLRQRSRTRNHVTNQMQPERRPRLLRRPQLRDPTRHRRIRHMTGAGQRQRVTTLVVRKRVDQSTHILRHLRGRVPTVLLVPLALLLEAGEHLILVGGEGVGH